jgi:hypothetical protein
MHVKVKFSQGFKDGSIFPDKPKGFAPGEFAILTEPQLAQVQRSGGVVEVVENVIPNPRKAQKELDAQQPQQLHDPYNAENSINDLESHIPGTEEMIEEQRIMQEALRERREEKARAAERGEPVLGFSNPEEREARERKEEVEAEREAAELEKQVEDVRSKSEQRKAERAKGVDASGQALQEPTEGDPQSELSDMLTQEQKDSIKPERASKRKK